MNSEEMNGKQGPDWPEQPGSGLAVPGLQWEMHLSTIETADWRKRCVARNEEDRFQRNGGR